MTTALCFDLDGTLVHWTRSHEAVMRATLADHGLEPEETLVATAEETFWSAHETMADAPFEQAMMAVLEEIDADGDPAAMVETLQEHSYAATTVPDAARESLAGLGEDDSLAVITNGVRDWQIGKLEYHGLTELFEVVVASYEAGAHKPDPAPFDLLRDRLPADEYVMVGDNYEADVEGARAAGFVPIHYEEDGPDLWSTIGALL